MADKKSIYWAARAIADEARANRIANTASNEIKSMYRRQYLRIVKQLTNLKADLDSGKALSRTELWTYSRWQQLEKELQKFVDEATRMETSTVHEALEKVFENTIGKKAREFDETRMTLAIEPESVINTAWSGQNYSARIWHNQAAIADRMKHSMEDMLVQGRGLREIKQQLMQEFGVAFRDADRLVRTEAAYVLNRATLARYKAEGISKVRWTTGIEDGDECIICAGRANKVYMLGNAPMIPAHPRCRCVYAGAVELEGENIEVDGPAADQAIEAAKAAEKAIKAAKKEASALKKAAESGIIKQESELGKFKKTLQADDRISDEYYSKLKNRFSHGSDVAKAVFNKYHQADIVEDANYFSTPHFNPETKKISMNYTVDIRNERGSGATYFHEYGHMIDDACGYISHDNNFRSYLDADAYDYGKAYGKLHSLKTWDKIHAAISKDLSSMRKHSGVSDIMGAVTKENVSGIAGHRASYWNNDSICEEAFSHMFECQFDKTRYAEMKKYFPKSLAYFETHLLKGALDK